MATALKNYQLYIGGEWVDATSDEGLEVINPATEETIGSVPQGSIADVDRAVAAARKAFVDGTWRRMPPRQRSDVLLRFMQTIADRKADLVDLIIAEAGAARWVAEGLQFDTGLKYAQWFAERTASFPFQDPLPPQVSARGLGQGVILKEPVGVVAAITPFNFPLYLNLSKVVPALAAGNSVVLKPSPYTPMQAFVLGEFADAAGLPPGVLNVVTGDVAAGEHLTTHPEVDMISFTGSDFVGKKIMSQAAEGLKKILLELGGKSPNIIFAGADVKKFAQGAAAGFTIHAGQGCAQPRDRRRPHRQEDDDGTTHPRGPARARRALRRGGHGRGRPPGLRRGAASRRDEGLLLRAHPVRGRHQLDDRRPGRDLRARRRGDPLRR
jgi:aldehyde dehydrogenase (NAD+)